MHRSSVWTSSQRRTLLPPLPEPHPWKLWESNLAWGKLRLRWDLKWRGGVCAVQLLLNLLAYTYETPKARGGQECASNRPPAVPVSLAKSWGSSDSHKPCTLPALSALKAPPDPSQDFTWGSDQARSWEGDLCPRFVLHCPDWDPVEHRACLYDSPTHGFLSRGQRLKASLVYCRAF